MNPLVTYLKSIRSVFSKFMVVGASGVLVNEGLLAILTEVYHVPVSWAGLIAIEASILSNFLLNNFWTWRSHRNKSFLIRLLQYHSVTMISGGVNYLILIGLTDLGIHHLLANLIGIGVGTVINFFMNHYWTFGRKAVSGDL